MRFAHHLCKHLTLVSLQQLVKLRDLIPLQTSITEQLCLPKKFDTILKVVNTPDSVAEANFCVVPELGN